MTNAAEKPSGAPRRFGVPWGHAIKSVPVPRRNPSTGFDQMAQVIPLAELYAMFASKVKMETVRSWRRGHRRAPAWAFEVLRNRLEKDAREANQRLADLDRAKKEGR